MKIINILIGVLIIFSSSILSTESFSQYVDKAEAKKVAISKIIQQHKSDRYQITNQCLEVKNEYQKNLFYVFGLNPKGYIVVTARTNLPPVIAYSYSNNFGSSNSVNNILLKVLKSDIKKRLEQIDIITSRLIRQRNHEWDQLIKGVDLKLSETFEQWPPEGTTSTGGWLETNWTQNAPYNNFCPKDPVTSNRSLAGCPAVAMAMIVNYYQTINETTFNNNDDYYHSYAGRNYWIDDDYEEHNFPSFPLLNNHLDTITHCYDTQEPLENEGKAALTFACGIAAHQVFTSEVSGTFGVDQALEAYLKFNFIDVILSDESDTSLYSKLSQNMMDARPVHLAVVDPGWTMGHNVVMDGYNTENYYHLNFGWGGSSNGWYLIPDEIPIGLTVIEGVIYNIAYPPLVTFEKQDVSSEIKSVFTISPNPCKNHTEIQYSVDFSGYIRIEVFDMTGKLIQTLLNKYKEPGIYKLSWNPKDQSYNLPERGVYVCRIQSNSATRLEKIIIQ